MALATHPLTLEGLRAACAAGTVLAIGTQSPGDAFTAESLAAETLIDWLQAGGARVTAIMGSSNLVADRSHLVTRRQQHEARWIAAGDLLERLHDHLTHDGTCQVVLYLDPWSTNLETDIRAWWPEAKRYALTAWDHLRHGDAACSAGDTYWTDFEGWVDALGVHGHLDVDDVLRSPLTSPSHPLAARPYGLPSDAKALPSALVLLDECGNAPPDMELVHGLLAAHDLARCVLLTPHLTWYQERNPELLASIGLALCTADLSPSVYAVLLRTTQRYCAPQGLPFGVESLRHLSAHAELTLPASETGIVAARWPARVQHLRTFDDQPSRNGGKTGGEGPSRVADQPGEGAPSLFTWWRQLTDLIAPASPSTPSAAAPAIATRQIALLTCCYKYLQRFRIFIDSVVRQTMPMDQIEVCVAAPGNPDGLLEYIALIQRVHPRLAIEVVTSDEGARLYKGKLLNAAFQRSSAPVIMVTDCDLVLPPTFLETVLRDFRPDQVMGCWRTALSPEMTARILVGDLDPVAEYETLRSQWDEAEIAGGVRQGLLGYCQVVARSAFERVCYPEEFEGFNQSDIVFIERLREQAQVVGHFRKDLFLLHLSHHRDWAGTKVYL